MTRRCRPIRGRDTEILSCSGLEQRGNRSHALIAVPVTSTDVDEFPILNSTNCEDSHCRVARISSVEI